MIRIAVDTVKNSQGWPLGIYGRIGLFGGAFGATGEALNLPPAVIEILVILIAAASATYYFARRSRDIRTEAKSRARAAKA